ncbi:MAG: hypothetical protein KKA62_01625 [Nanoarchaeota archaeon]|nr:hypothetical protein [Nanoarchaeota archaeon]MBU1643554.1 hypothetical protein [Nanoarchaeota archaeon]MBU1976632.1 hypothetical protein [Nanoarchaeota archaeon]
MKSYRNIYPKVCSSENINLAWKKARKRKTLKRYVVDFEKDIENNLNILRIELLLHSYRPKPLRTFILRDPKTRKISVSDFRDRIVHQAICNVIEPIFEKSFIYDSYANRKGKGTLTAIKRLEKFQRKVSKNKTIVRKSSRKNNFRGFYLKGDIKSYFDSIDHKRLIEIISRKIKDKELLFLIQNIILNHNSKDKGEGMPLGNLTSQFLANVYLNELDHFIKYQLKVKYYVRYVDDFVILHNDKNKLGLYKEKINNFLKTGLLIELNTDKSKIKPLSRGVGFLGFRIFHHHRLLKKKSTKRIYKKLDLFEKNYSSKKIDYDYVYNSFEGWIAYVRNANTYKLRKRISELMENRFQGEISTKEINGLIKFQNTIFQFQKFLFLATSI